MCDVIETQRLIFNKIRFGDVAPNWLRTLGQALHGERGGGLEALERSAEPGAWRVRLPLAAAPRPRVTRAQ